jgi:hypothetical protein
VWWKNTRRPWGCSENEELCYRKREKGLPALIGERRLYTRRKSIKKD